MTTENALPTMEKVVAELPTALTKLTDAANLGPVTTQTIIEKMGPLVLKREELFQEADKILTLDPALPSTQKKAEESRKAIKRIRLAGESARKELKDDFLRGGKAIDGIGHAVTDPCEEMEEKLERVEKYAIILENKQREERRVARETVLRPFSYDFSMYGNLGELTDQQFTQIHQSFIALKAENDRAAAAKAAAEAEAEKKRLEEEAKIREDNLRLQREKEEQDRKHREDLAKLEADRKAKEEQERREREAIEAENRRKLAEQERAAAAERLRLAKEAEAREAAEREARRQAEEKAAAERQAREEAEAKARAEREALERQLAAQREAEEKRLEAERKAREAEARARKRAEAAPDATKLAELLKVFDNFELPKVKTERAQQLILDIRADLESTSMRIREYFNALKAEQQE